jgi:hypothetical protein
VRNGTPLLSAGHIAPDLMFKGQAFGQPPFVLGSAIGGIDTEPVMQNPALCLEIRGSDEFHHPFQIFHEPSPSLLKVARS